MNPLLPNILSAVLAAVRRYGWLPLAVFLAHPEESQEFSYAGDQAGFHYFVHNLPGRPCLWKIAPEGEVTVADRRVVGVRVDVA